MERRRLLEVAGASAAAALSGCMGVDRMYGDYVSGNIESDIEDMSPEEAAEYFLNEQRDFDEIGGVEGLMTDQVHVNYDVETGEYDVRVTFPSNLEMVKDYEDAERYEEATGDTFQEEMVGADPEDSLFFMDNGQKVYQATSAEQALRDLSYHLAEGAELPYRVFEGKGTDRPVARGEFIDNEAIREQVSGNTGQIEVRILTEEGMIRASYDEQDLDEMLDQRHEITSSDMDFIEGNWEIW